MKGPEPGLLSAAGNNEDLLKSVEDAPVGPKGTKGTMGQRGPHVSKTVYFGVLNKISKI